MKPRVSAKSTPRTSLERLEKSIWTDGFSAAAPTFPSLPPVAASPEPDTVLYLAYGSNLCAETFLGNRGIRPLSQVNVSAPSLRLTFDLPGMPYTEPCFANTALRKIPKDPLPDPRDPIKPPPVPTPPGPVPIEPPEGRPKTWEKGLVGVVYEVTRADYQHIVATEGAGASYKEILVPCLVIPPRMRVPEQPGDVIPRPFLARTLCAPKIPDGADDGGDGDDDGGGGGPEDPRKKWWWKFVRGPVRKEGYAQPSARYLKLITDGAKEHELPEEYQAYLLSLQPYTITRRSQEVGKVIMTLLTFPIFLCVKYVFGRFADDKGRVPTWMGVVMGLWFSLVWGIYDTVMKPLFGDGEKTEEQDEERKGRERRKMAWGRGDEKCWWDEKRGLLGDVERGHE